MAESTLAVLDDMDYLDSDHSNLSGRALNMDEVTNSVLEEELQARIWIARET